MLTEQQLQDCIHKRKLSRSDSVLLIISVNSETAKNVQEIKRIGRAAGLPELLKWNISDILNRSKGLAINIPEGWILTSEGKKYVSNLDVFPSLKSVRAVNVVQDLRNVALKITHKETVDFVSEAIACFEAGLNKACVVFSWVGAVSLLYEHVISNHLVAFNTEARRRDSSWKYAVSNDDLARMKESEFLDIIASPPISLIGKTVKEELKNNCLGLRNGCGHPNSLKIGENKVAAHLEILIMNIFVKFGI